MSSTGTKPAPEQPVVDAPVTKPEDHLFEQEAELEKSGISFRLVAIVVLVVAALIGGGYLILHQTALSVDDASRLVTASLDARGPATMNFRVGHVEPSAFQKPHGPHYRLLSDAKIVTTRDDKQGGIYANITPDGELVVNKLEGFKKVKNTDGTETYSVPLAARELVKVNSVTMAGPNAAKVQYTWRWKPNVLGKQLDAAGDLVHKFNTWDRAQLIQEYGVDFFGETKTTTVDVVRGDNGWKIGRIE